MDAVKHKFLAGKPMAELRTMVAEVFSEGSLSCFDPAHTLRVLATFWFGKGSQLFNWHLEGINCKNAGPGSNPPEMYKRFSRCHNADWRVLK